LHLKEGLAVIKEKTRAGKVVRPAPSNLNGGANRRAPLISAPYFTVDMFELKEPQSFRTIDGSGKRSVQILVAVEGCGIVEAPGANPVTLARGDAVVVPAAVGEFQVRPQWSVEFLKASVPSGSVPEPETRM
jgi:mannose-6-phosphate isomerase class I